MLNWVDPDTKEDGASSVVEETAVVTCETGEVTGDDVVNPSTIDEPTPDADENEENSSDKEEEKESGKEKEPGEEDKEPGEEQKEPEEGVELESRRNDEHAEETGETQAARQHQTETHAEV